MGVGHNDLHMDASRRGFTLTNLVVVVAVVALLAAVLILPSKFRRAKADANFFCPMNLKTVGLAFRVWAGDHQDKFPMAIPAESGGTKGYTTGVDTYRHFLVMSNELGTPKILACPLDNRTNESDFTLFNNQNLGYWVNLDTTNTNPDMFLAGDRNLTCDQPPVSGVLKLSPGQKLGWSAQMHIRRGNVLLADGSAMTYSNSAAVTAAFRASGDSTNVWRLSLPE